jgi:hypothetical protein
LVRKFRPKRFHKIGSSTQADARQNLSNHSFCGSRKRAEYTFSEQQKIVAYLVRLLHNL